MLTISIGVLLALRFVKPTISLKYIVTDSKSSAGTCANHTKKKKILSSKVNPIFDISLPVSVALIASQQPVEAFEIVIDRSYPFLS